MKIFDIHTHAYPDNIASKAVQNLGNFYNFNLTSKGTVQDLISIQREGGSSGFLLFSVATVPEQVQKINDFLYSTKELYSTPDMRIECFAAMHQNYKDTISEVDRITELGFKGIKIHPDFQQVDIDSDLLYPLYEYIEGKLPLYLHAGDERYSFSDPVKVIKVKKRFPRLTIIAAHLGGYQKWEDFEINYRNTDVYIDTSSALWAISSQKAKDIIRFHGADRVLFGTDYPITSVKCELHLLSELNLTYDETEKILYKNAQKLLNLT